MCRLWKDYFSFCKFYQNKNSSEMNFMHQVIFCSDLITVGNSSVWQHKICHDNFYFRETWFIAHIRSTFWLEGKRYLVYENILITWNGKIQTISLYSRESCWNSDIITIWFVSGTEDTFFFKHSSIIQQSISEVNRRSSSKVLFWNLSTCNVKTLP